MKKVFGCLLVLVAVPLFGGVAFADDPVTELEITHQGTVDLDIHFGTVNGVRYETTTGPDGSTVIISRELATTWPYTTQDTSTESVTSRTAVAAEVTDPNNPYAKCCCWYYNFGFIKNFDDDDIWCAGTGYNCEWSVYSCVCGFINCPAGTKREMKLEEGLSR